VTVTADAPVLDLERGSVGTNMNGKIVTDLPLSILGGGRNAEDFAVALTPGYSPIRQCLRGRVNGAVVHQGHHRRRDPGTSSSKQHLWVWTTMEAVETAVPTSGLDAQSSITGGALIAFNLKSGPNKLHGFNVLYGHNELAGREIPDRWDNLGQGKPKWRAWDYGFSRAARHQRQDLFLRRL